MKYNFSEAAGRLQKMRRKVIILKGGQGVEGLSSLSAEKDAVISKNPKVSKAKEINA